MESVREYHNTSRMFSQISGQQWPINGEVSAGGPLGEDNEVSITQSSVNNDTEEVTYTYEVLHAEDHRPITPVPDSTGTVTLSFQAPGDFVQEVSEVESTTFSDEID